MTRILSFCLAIKSCCSGRRRHHLGIPGDEFYQLEKELEHDRV